MTMEELKNNPELLARMEQEAKALAEGGMDRASAVRETLKKHGIEADADAAKAAAVERLPLGEEELESVSGGTAEGWVCTRALSFTAVGSADCMLIPDGWVDTPAPSAAANSDGSTASYCFAVGVCSNSNGVNWG